ncbi:MAG: T9SS type A sorting domain-containing protein, partial [Bacteroidetes bacterium]|nr:T9SS type A sorting domain-containing protein [Bacteroidota bacterium]
MKGFDLNRKVSVMVTDVLGRRVAQYETNAPQIMIGNKLQAGTYQVQLVQGNSRQSLTIVKE